MLPTALFGSSKRRRGNRRREEIDAEREKLNADVDREIDAIATEMHDLLPRHKASSIGIGYARYSTEFQHSVGDQIRGVFEFAVKHGIFIPRENIFFDLATRGCKERRPGLDQVRQLLIRKAAQVLLVFTTNRLFRKNYKCMKFVEEEVVERGLRCVFVKTLIDTAEDNRWRLPLQVHALVDEMASTQYAENIRAAHEGLFLKKYVISTVPYGYVGKVVDGPLTKRSKPRRELAIEPETSVWVQRIFQWFVTDRMKIARILERLNDQEVPFSPMSNGVYWTHQALAYLLRNECYRGRWYYGKGKNIWQSKQDYSKRVLRDKPLREADFQDLRLVSDEVWYKAQQLLASQPQANAGRKPLDENSTKRPRILNGLLWCKDHATRLKVGGTQGEFMYCQQCRNLSKAKRPLYSYLNRALALRLVCGKIAELIRADADLCSKVIAACQKEADQYQRGDVGDLDKQRARHDRITSQIQFVLKNPGETDLDRDESNQRLKQLRGERAGIAAEIARREAAIQQPNKIPTEKEVQGLIAKLDTLLVSAAQNEVPEDIGVLRQVMEIMTGGRIELEQMGERLAHRGFLRGRFQFDLVSSIQDYGGIVTESSQSAPVEVVIDFRERTVAEQHMTAIKEMWDKGMLVTAIANALGIDRHQVTAGIRIWHQERGLPVPPDGRRRRASVPQKCLDSAAHTALLGEVKRFYDQGLLMCQIAELVGRDATTIRNLLDEWCRVNNVPRLDGRNRRKRLSIKNRPRPSE